MNAAASMSASVSSARPLRVILVGRTGLEGKLRGESGIEVVSVRGAVTAVGELVASLREGKASGHVVVIAADADPAVVHEAQGPRIDPARAGEFLAALRGLDTSARVLRLEARDGSAPVRAGYDGIVSEDADAESLRAAIRGMAPPASAARSVTGAMNGGGASGAASVRPMASGSPPMLPHPVEVAAPAPDAAAEAEGEIGDERLVRLLLHGRDPTEAATEAIRRRLRTRDVWFEPSPAGQGAAPGPHECAVVYREQTLGRLRSAAVPARVLRAQAEWLGAWIALRDQHAQLREAAFTDPLTGAYNRRYFDHFLNLAIEQARVQRRTVTVLAFDIDDFKRYNDRFGHAAGDEILRESVRLLQSLIRPTDRVCRIGGDEFAVIFHDPEGPRSATSRPPGDVAQIARRFQQAIMSQRFPKLGDMAPGTLGISGGLATFPWDGQTPEELLIKADELALESKRAGKDAITVGPGARRASEEGGTLGGETGTPGSRG